MIIIKGYGCLPQHLPSERRTDEKGKVRGKINEVCSEG